MEKVDLIACGYEWVCSKCETFNRIIAIPQGGMLSRVVKCTACEEEFGIGDIEDAMD